MRRSLPYIRLVKGAKALKSGNKMAQNTAMTQEATPGEEIASTTIPSPQPDRAKRNACTHLPPRPIIQTLY